MKNNWLRKRAGTLQGEMLLKVKLQYLELQIPVETKISNFYRILGIATLKVVQNSFQLVDFDRSF